jgi:hypothetical protein
MSANTPDLNLTLEDQEHAAEAFARLIRWCLCTSRGRGLDRRVGRRLIAATWVGLPEALDGVSLRGMARAIGTSPRHLAELTGEFSRDFKLRSRGQSHAANFEMEPGQ